MMSKMNATKRFSTLSRTCRGPAIWMVLIVCLLTLTFMGCGDAGVSSEDQGASADESGQVVIGLTDAQGDFITYGVDLLSLTLTRADGTTVHTLPLTTRVDFAQYTEMTEFLTAATIPRGTYVKAQMALDFENADIQVADAQGNAQPVDLIQSEEGQIIDTLTVDVHLKGRQALTIVPGVPAHLTLDFDLKASNGVEFREEAVVVTVKPVLLGEVNPERPKIHRVRGPLKAVDLAGASFDIIIRPFVHRIRDHSEPFGVLQVTTQPETLFDIDGDQLVGLDGLNALAAKQELTAVVALGDLVIAADKTPVFKAREVQAGSSVPGGILDVVEGSVVARDGDTLRVRGATLIRAQGEVVFNDQVAVVLGPDTRVKKQLSQEAFHIDDVSVGQRVRIFGQLNDAETELDATQGHLRMLLTTLKGHVVAAETTLDLDLSAINGHAIDRFDFYGTGAVQDADPANYVVAPAALPLTDLGEGTPVKVKGFETPFGHGEGQADFTAQSIVDLSQVRALLHVTWWPASGDAIVDLSAQGFSLDLTGHGRFHHVSRHGLRTELSGLEQQPIIVPHGDGYGFFTIHDATTGEHHFFLDFDDFSARLADELDQGRGVKSVVAKGLFDDGHLTMAADLVNLSLK